MSDTKVRLSQDEAETLLFLIRFENGCAVDLTMRSDLKQTEKVNTIVDVGREMTLLSLRIFKDTDGWVLLTNKGISDILVKWLHNFVEESFLKPNDPITDILGVPAAKAELVLKIQRGGRGKNQGPVSDPGEYDNVLAMFKPTGRSN